MIDDERPDAPQDEGAGDPGDQAAAPEDAQPSPSADPSESPVAGDEDGADEAAAEESAGDEDLATVEDAQEEVSEPPAEDAPEVVAEEPAAGQPAEGQPAAEEPAPDQPAEEPAPEELAPGQPAEPAAEEPRRERPKRDEKDDKKKDEVVPGAHLEPDLVLEEKRPEGELDEYAARYGAPDDGDEETAPAATADAARAPAEEAAPRTALDLAADARYQATGKRKTSVARVILKPGSGSYSINGRSLEDYFPRAALQTTARQPLTTAGFDKRMDVVARIHGGGISAQAGALRHGVARALVEADPALRAELKRRGFLSRDARAKERKKAGLKKARKRPQFSKR